MATFRRSVSAPPCDGSVADMMRAVTARQEAKAYKGTSSFLPVPLTLHHVSDGC